MPYPFLYSAPPVTAGRKESKTSNHRRDEIRPRRAAEQFYAISAPEKNTHDAPPVFIEFPIMEHFQKQGVSPAFYGRLHSSFR